jgi:hypothetical protein
VHRPLRTGRAARPDATLGDETIGPPFGVVWRGVRKHASEATAVNDQSGRVNRSAAPVTTDAHDGDVSSSLGPVPFPTAGIDPRTVLATALHAAPGVYAGMVGSGMSSAAGILTGWQVVEDLVRRIARAEGVEPVEFESDPAGWWSREDRGDLRYDTLVGQLAATDAARQLLLRSYFDPSPEMGGPVQPTSGHFALANLAAAGRVRVILTTNFDRLIERALDSMGVSPQVVSTPSQVRGMTPLPHAPVTVIKLHGDYAQPPLRNTPDELAHYPDEWTALLERVFDEYGLLVVGWSAVWDLALAEALRSCPNHRYPVFWTAHHGRLEEAAKVVVANRRAIAIPVVSADEFLCDTIERVERLDRIALRRRRPQLADFPIAGPSTTSTEGWSVAPLLHVRVAATIPMSVGGVEFIRGAERRRITNVLEQAALTADLREMRRSTIPTWAEPAEEEQPAIQDPLSGWFFPPGSHQTHEHVTLRLGGDGSCGIGALAAVRPARYGQEAGTWFLIIDLGISVTVLLDVTTVATLIRDGLMLATAGLPEALSSIFRADAQADRAEGHLKTITPTRQTTLDTRVGLNDFGVNVSRVGGEAGFSAWIDGPLGINDASELTAAGLEYVALAHGYLDPERGIRRIRESLGLTLS